MQLIPLTQGFTAIVDDADYADLSRFKWFTRIHKKAKSPQPYAIRHIVGSVCGQLTMHDHLMQPPEGLMVDHQNGDTLDYRRHNLRICTEQQNTLNKRGRGGTSVFKGVWWRKDTARWSAEIRVNKRRTSLGCFDDEIDAAVAYDTAARDLHGEFARLNFPLDPAQPSAQHAGPGYGRRHQEAQAA